MEEKKKKIRYVLIAAAVILAIAMLVILLPRGDKGSAPAGTEAEKTPARVVPTPVPTVTLGGEEYPADISGLCPRNVSFEELETALESFPALRELDVRALELTDEQKHILLGTGLDVLYNVEILGKTCPHDTQSLDLSEMTPEDAEAVASALSLLPGLKSAVLPPQSEDISSDLKMISALRQAAPRTEFKYDFKLFGNNISLSDTEVSFRDADIGNKKVGIFYELIPCMKDLERLVLDDCGVDDEIMAELRDAFPEVSVVWRVHWNNYSALTDTRMIRALSTTSGSSTDSLKYCSEVRYIDMGHSENLYNIEFTRYMPHLKMLIIADSAVTDIEPLSECKELMFIELVNCFNLTDISPLAECKALRFLNISNTISLEDMSAIFELPDLERVYASYYHVPEEQVDKLRELHPDCWVTFGRPEPSRVSYNYSVGWRLDAPPNEMADWYVELRKIFGIGSELYDGDGYYSYKNVKPYDIPYDELKIFTPD